MRSNHLPNSSTWRRRATGLLVALAIAVGAPLAAGVPASAAPAAGATVSGNVKGAGSPAVNLEGVSVMLSSTDEDAEGYWSHTDSDGNYEFQSVAPGTYEIYFDAAEGELNYVSKAWGASANGEAATFVVTAGSTHTGKNVVLAAGGSISGKVTYADSPGTGMGEAWVHAFNADYSSYGSASTDEDGNYRIYGLAAGAHIVEFSNYGGGMTDQSYVSQWWDNKPTEEEAKRITVIVGQDQPGKNAALVAGGMITGAITDTAGKPLTDIMVPVWKKQGTTWDIVDYAYTYEEGQYWAVGLAIGSYKIGFGEDINWKDELVGTVYQPQYFSGKTSLSAANVINITSVGQVVTNPTVKLAKKGATPAPAPAVERFSGDDRYATGVDISKKSFSPGVKVVYVATGLAFPDALAAAPAAAAQGGPLLLTAANKLPALVKAEIDRLNPEKIVVVGGNGAVSASVYNELSKLTPSIRRDAGADRFETSRTIVEKAFPAGAATAFVATAWNFPDALAASAAAGAIGAPVVLVDGKATSVDAKTKTLLASLKVKTAKVAGGTGVVSTKVETSLKSILGNANVTRLGGADRYTTAAVINKASFTKSDTVYLANGLGFADALAGAALAGKNKAPLYTVYANCVPKLVLDEIKRLGATKVVLLGGAGVLSANVHKLGVCK